MVLLWDVIVVVIITFIIGNGRWVRVWARGDKILITELDFIVTGGVTIILLLCGSHGSNPTWWPVSAWV
jgi:hypothetical protein